MSYPYGAQDGNPSRSLAAYDAQWPQFTGAANRRTSPVNQMVWLVLVLGLSTYVVSVAAVVQHDGAGWAVRFSTLSGVVAAVGLLRRQSAHTKIIAALAVMGFLEALSQLIVNDQNPRWSAIVILVLNALQAVTAIAALLAQLRVPDAAEPGPASYDASAYYAQAAQQYYTANNQQLRQEQAHGMAQAEAAAAAQAQQAAAERYALYADYVSAQQSGPNRAASSPPDGFMPTDQPLPGTGTSAARPVDNNRPRNDPATGSPTQSSF